MAVSKLKWYIVASPDGDWYQEPVQALNALDAIVAVEATNDQNDPQSSVLRAVGNSWRVFEAAGPDFLDFKTEVKLVPAS